MNLKTVNSIQRIEVQSGDTEPQYAVIWLHGLGASADDFVPAVPYLKLDVSVKFVFPQAPERPITINGGMVMPGWYDIKGINIEDKQDKPGMEQSAAVVQTLIAELEEQGIPSERIFLFGFSQGGAVAYYQALRHPKPLAGLVALSTYLPFAEEVQSAKASANQHIPILVNHGRFDAVVPIVMGETSVRQLQTLGYSVDYATFAIEHSVSIDQLEQLGVWLADTIKAKKLSE